jgi:hypothetical protein
MRIQAIAVQHFLSLRNVCLDQLDAPVIYIVGPNGAGKTAIFRALRIIRDACTTFARADNQQFTAFQAALQPRLFRSDPAAPATELRLAIEVTFDTPWEQDLMAAFLCAALSHPETFRQLLARRNSAEPWSEATVLAGVAYFSTWLSRQLRPEAIPFVYQGTLRLIYQPGITGQLLLTSTFCCADTPLTIVAGVFPYGQNGILCQGEPAQLPIPGDPTDALFSFLAAQQLQESVDALLRQRDSAPPALPDLDRSAVADLFTTLAGQRVVLSPRGVSPIPPYPEAVADQSKEGADECR